MITKDCKLIDLLLKYDKINKNLYNITDVKEGGTNNEWLWQN